MTTQSNALDVIAYWKSACETANGMVLALMDDCAGLRADKNALIAERDALRTALRETREALEHNARCLHSRESEVGKITCAVLARYAGLVEDGV